MSAPTAPLACALARAPTDEAASLPPLAPFVAFDLEMSGLLPQGEWPADGSSPVRILCAATARVGSKGEEPHVRTWHNTAAAYSFPLPWMGAVDLCALLDYLWEAVGRGETVVSWGGLSSDWRVLAAEIRDHSPLHAARCAVLARAHVDIAFAAATSLGGMMGLRAACAGMGLETKHPDSSAMVPMLWAVGQGGFVLAHVAADALATAQVYAGMFQGGGQPQLSWLTARGTVATWYAPWLSDGGKARLLTVDECLARPIAKTKYEVPPHMAREAQAGWLPKA